jgi:hypothetical protein
MVGVILPLLIGVYSLGAFAPARSQRIIGAASIAAALIAHDLTDPVLDSWQQALGAAAFWILFPVAWLLGDYTRTRRLYVTAIRDQAERAQRDREQQTHLEIAQDEPGSPASCMTSSLTGSPSSSARPRPARFAYPPTRTVPVPHSPPSPSLPGSPSRRCATRSPFYG